MGGNILDYTSALQVIKLRNNASLKDLQIELNTCEVIYNKPLEDSDTESCNNKGLIAYLDYTVAISILKTLNN